MRQQRFGRLVLQTPSRARPLQGHHSPGSGSQKGSNKFRTLVEGSQSFARQWPFVRVGWPSFILLWMGLLIIGTLLIAKMGGRP